MKPKHLLGLFLTVVSAFAADVAPFQLKGVLNTGSQTLFGLSTATGDQSAWVPIGKQFDGYTLKSFDETKGVLALEQNGKTVEIALATAKILTGETKVGTPATVEDAAAVVNKLRFEEMIEKTMAGQKKMAVAMAKQMASRMGSKVDPKDLEAYQSKMMDAIMEAMDLPQLKKDLTDIYAKTFTKEELTAMSDFYATPAGEALVDKQPEVQQELQQVIMPRIMAAGPKLQQINMEFVQQQQAKAKAAAAANAAANTATAPASTPATK